VAQCQSRHSKIYGQRQSVIIFVHEVNDLITVDADFLGGTPVFKGTRVPVKSLFDYLENNYTLDEFLECFPSVTRELVRRVLESSKSALLTRITGITALNSARIGDG
jgi:uncharacterized protein (DUF433 family)